MTRPRLFALLLSLLGATACGSSPGTNPNNNTAGGNKCLCYINTGPGYDSCTENLSYGCDCSMGGGAPVQEPPCP